MVLWYLWTMLTVKLDKTIKETSEIETDNLSRPSLDFGTFVLSVVWWFNRLLDKPWFLLVKFLQTADHETKADEDGPWKCVKNSLWRMTHSFEFQRFENDPFTIWQISEITKKSHILFVWRETLCFQHRQWLWFESMMKLYRQFIFSIWGDGFYLRSTNRDFLALAVEFERRNVRGGVVTVQEVDESGSIRTVTVIAQNWAKTVLTIFEKWKA